MGKTFLTDKDYLRRMEREQAIKDQMEAGLNFLRPFGVTKYAVIPDDSTGGFYTVIHWEAPSGPSPEAAIENRARGIMAMSRRLYYPTRPDKQTIHDRQRGFE